MSYDDIQEIIDEGLGFAADELGPPHDVYRVTAASSGNFLDPSNRIATGVSVFTKVAYGSGVREALETEKQQGIIWYRLIADLTDFRVGDVFVNTDQVYGKGMSSVSYDTAEFNGFALAERAPIKKALAGRINCTVTVHRAAEVTNDEFQFDRTKNIANPVVLQSGVFSLGAHGADACRLPAGLYGLRSYGDRQFAQSPAEGRKASYVLYMPALNGFRAKENDIVTDFEGTQYRVVVPYTQEVGTTGAQWFLEREA